MADIRLADIEADIEASVGQEALLILTVSWFLHLYNSLGVSFHLPKHGYVYVCTRMRAYV